MKVSAVSVLAVALGVSATPVTLEKRTAAPVNAGALTLIETLEGFKANFYTINGHKTIGYGHDCVERGGCDSLHPPITKAQGATLLKSDITEYETCVCALPNAGNLNANQYGALVSFTYNSGCGGVSKYFNSYMQSSNFAGICSALPTTNTLNGELSSRRQKEGAFCSEASNARSGCQGGGTAPTGTKAAFEDAVMATKPPGGPGHPKPTKTVTKTKTIHPKEDEFADLPTPIQAAVDMAATKPPGGGGPGGPGKPPKTVTVTVTHKPTATKKPAPPPSPAAKLEDEE